MKACPHCGHDNRDTATLCEQCHEALPAPDSAVETTAQPPTEEPPGAPSEGIPVWPGRPAQESPPSVDPIGPSRHSFWTENGPYLWGLGLGLVPTILWLFAVWFLAASASGQGEDAQLRQVGLLAILLGLEVIVYVIELVVMITCLVKERSRLFGYGLLTGLLIAPVVAVTSCSIMARPH
jgi:zinc-ribbon domain